MQIIIDERLNKIIEDYFISLNIDIIKINRNKNIYYEISSHTDIHCLKIDNDVVSSNNLINSIIGYNHIISNCINGSYPNTAKYNVCIIDNYAIHNFNYTDGIVKELLIKKGYKLINIKQGYARCNILPLDNKSCITSDKGIYNTLQKNGFDVLYIDFKELDIKLLKEKDKFKQENQYSDMIGFIGGASCIINDTVVFFGDIDKLNCKTKLRKYIYSKGYKIKDFKDLDIIDYGSAIFLD